MNKTIVIMMLVCILLSATAFALGDNLKFEYVSGVVTINTTLITGTNIYCGNITGAASDLCTVAGAAGGGNTTLEIQEAVNESGANYNISIPCSLIVDDASGGDANFCVDASAAGSGEKNSLDDVDNIYIYNNSGAVTFNATYNNFTTNASIDLRVNVGFLQNLLDSIYATITDVHTWIESVGNFTEARSNIAFTNETNTFTAVQTFDENISVDEILRLGDRVTVTHNSTNGLWNNIFSTDNAREPNNNLIAIIESNGTNGTIMPHFWIQGGGADQASGVSRSFMIVNEVVALQNTTNITSCTAVQDQLGVDSEFRVDCNTSTTGADLLVGDDILIGGDFKVTDSEGEYHSLNKLIQVLDEVFNNLLFNKINASVQGANLEISDNFGETLRLELNASATDLQSVNDSIALNTGTLIAPSFNYVSYQNPQNPVLTITGSIPTVDHADVARAYIGSTTDEIYLLDDITSHGRQFVDHTYDRFDDEGALYKSGLDITSGATTINISTGSVRLRIAQVDYVNEVNSTLDFYWINFTGNFLNDTSNTAFTQYQDGGAITANKFFNVIWGVVPVNSTKMRLVAVVQDEPSAEYSQLVDAEADKFNTINFFPNNVNIKKTFIPVARTIIKQTGTLDFETLSNGLFHFDIRGQVTAAGGSPAAPSITNHDELSNLDFASAGHTGFTSTLEFDNDTIVRNQNQSSFVTANITSGDGNTTFTGGSLFLGFLDLAEFDNSVSTFITTTVSTLTNYFTKTESITFMTSNISDVNISQTAFTITQINAINTSENVWGFIGINQTWDTKINTLNETKIQNGTDFNSSNIVVDNYKFNNGTQRIHNNGTCIIITGSTSDLEIC